MKNFLILSILIFSFLSCCTTNRRFSRFDHIPSSDSTCIKDVIAAKKDVEKGKLVYMHHAGNLLFFSLRCEHEMDSILNLYGIDYRDYLTSDVVWEGQTQGCYADYMDEVIKEKFGDKFIDSLLIVSDSLFLWNNINSTFFDYYDCDTRPNYPGDTSTYEDEISDVFQADFDRSIHYPKDYIKRPNSDLPAFVDIAILVDKYGNAKIRRYNFLFDFDKNYAFEGYLKSVIERVMKRTNWTPATIKKQNVNSEMNFRLSFD